MAERGRDKDPDRESKSKPDNLTNRLNRLQKDLDTKTGAARRGSLGKAGEGRSGSADYSRALRLSTEFVAAILVGAGLGWGVDRLFGTKPWGMIILLLLGFAAGVMNVLRSAQTMTDPQDPQD